MPSFGGGAAPTPPPDPSSLPQLLLLALLIPVLVLLFFWKVTSRWFAVDDDASFCSDAMSIGCGGGGDRERCAVCVGPGPKRCSGCKSVFYCSQACQSKHWAEGHKLKCRQTQTRPYDNIDSFSLPNNVSGSKSHGFSSIALVASRRSCKVLREPEKILFPYEEFVKLFNWDKPGFPPCGLRNCGNSCFANVVLQCLSCTRPLAAYLLEGDHHKGCIRRLNDWCFLCELQVHIQRACNCSVPFSPNNILSHIRKIGNNFDYGKQEDAHEFMRFTIDTMQSVCLDEFGGEKMVAQSSQETTLVQHIFGGHLRSQVKCTKCNLISNRYDRMMDLAVEIQGDAGSLEECLVQFTAEERLDGENMYKCDGCNEYVKAWKRLTVHQAPNVLTITLKRFQSGRFGKLNKRVTFPEYLDLACYMSGESDGSDRYMLYAVVVHVDMLNSSFFGHYICYTRDFNGNWYMIDDCKVVDVQIDEVLSQNAYMLLYSRRDARRQSLPKTEAKTKMQLLNETGPLSTTATDAGQERDLPSEEALQEYIGTAAAIGKDSRHDNLHVYAANSNTGKLEAIQSVESDVDCSSEKPCTISVVEDDGVGSKVDSMGPEYPDGDHPEFHPGPVENGFDVKLDPSNSSFEEPCFLAKGLGMGGTNGFISGIEADSSVLDTCGLVSVADTVCPMVCDRLESDDATSTDIQVGGSMSSFGIANGYVRGERCLNAIPVSESAKCHSSFDGHHPSAFEDLHEGTAKDAGVGGSVASVAEEAQPEVSSEMAEPLPLSSSPVQRRAFGSGSISGAERFALPMENGFSGKPKPMLSRGFLDRPRKKKASHGKLIKKQLDVSFTSNGLSNGIFH